MSLEYDELMNLMHDASDLNGVLSLLGWDQETYMPPKGLAMRARQMKTLSSLLHQKKTEKRVGELLDALEQPAKQRELGETEKIVLRELRYDYERERKLPTELVEQIAETTSLATEAWREARETSDFTLFAPWLTKVMELMRRKADAYGYEQSPYDALIEDFERGMTAATIRPIFQRMRDRLAPMIKKISEAQKPDGSMLERRYDPAKQWTFGMEVLEAMGFDLQAGRQDKSAHPFTSGTYPSDIRLTTRVYPDNFSVALFSTLHEGGHGLYEQGFPPSLIDTVLAAAPSLGLHESQSRLWENLVGRSRSFWRRYFPRVQELFPEALQGVTEEQFYRAINLVEPSFIRVEADEATYPLHIILRFELEQGLIEGTIRVDDLPELWNEKMRELLGITPPDVAHGVLQDIHWGHGLVGYFPTYAIGNLYSAQIVARMRQDIPDLDAVIARGELRRIRDWLAEHIYSQGRARLANDLIRHVCGEGLNEQYFLDYVAQKFGAIYDLKLD